MKKHKIIIFICVIILIFISIQIKSKAAEIKIQMQNINHPLKITAYHTPYINKIIPKFTYDPFEKSNLTTEDYNIMLMGTGLENCGEFFYKTEQNDGINGLFALSVAMHESALGKQPLRGNNYFGMTNCSFNSKGSNILYFGKLMQSELYHNKSISAIAKVYCPDPIYKWDIKVKQHMRERWNILNKNKG